MQEEVPIDDVHLVDGIRVIEHHHTPRIRANPRAVVALIMLTGCLGIGISFILTREAKVVPQDVRTYVPASVAPALTASRALSETLARWNLDGALPTGWTTATNTHPLPEGVTNAIAIYVLPGTACAIAYAQFPVLTATNTYPRTSENEAVTRNGVLIGQVERRIPSDYSSTPEPGSVASPYRAHEIALAYQPLFYDNGSGNTTRNAFVLFSNDDAPLPNICHMAFTELIRSLEPSYPPRILSLNDTGLLYIEYHEELGTLLLFRDDITHVAHLVTALDVGPIFKPTLRDTVLYYVGTDGLLKQYTLFQSMPPSTLPLPLTPEESVNNFLVASSSIVYLEGVWCHHAPETCDLTLAHYDLVSGTTGTVSEHLTTPSLPPENTTRSTTTASVLRMHGTSRSGPERFEGSDMRRLQLVYIESN